MSVRTGTGGSGRWGFAKHVAAISLSSQGTSSSTPSFQGTSDRGIWCQVTGRHPGQPGVLCHHTQARWAFHTTDRGYAVWSGAQEPHVSDTLDITLPKTICHCLQWSTPPGKISSQLTPGPVGCGQGHRANGRSHPAGVIRAQEPRVTWARRNMHLPRARGPMALSERDLGKGPPWCSCPNGMGVCGSQACAPSRWETLHHCEPSFLASSASSLLLNWVCSLWEAK